MKSRETIRIAVFLVAFAAMAWMFVMVVWIPLYGYRQTNRFVSSMEELPMQAVIEREDGTGVKSWPVADQQALSRLRDSLRHADYTGVREPRADQKYRVRLRRPDSRVDEYEVLLDERGSEHDVLYVVHRTGGATIYGSAFKTPELRQAIQQVLSGPAAAPK